MAVIRAAIFAVLEADHPKTVRGTFYRLVIEGVIAKTELEYKTVKRLLAEMRRSGEIPYEWLADGTRWMRKPATYSSTGDALRCTAETYRRALWEDSAVAVEIWLEKEALAGVLVEITDEWDVPLMVTRGYPSMSFLHSAAEAIRGRSEWGQRTQIYYFGDRDPSGVDIDRAVVEGIGESLSSLSASDCRFADHADFARVAVTEEQISEWDLETRPTKGTDARAKTFKGESVELDALDAFPGLLRELARRAIESHVDHHQLKVLRVYEAEERRQMLQIAATLNGESA